LTLPLRAYPSKEDINLAEYQNISFLEKYSKNKPVKITSF